MNRRCAKPELPSAAREDLAVLEWNPQEAWRCRIRVPRRLYAASDIEVCDALELTAEDEERSDSEHPQLTHFLG